MINPDRASGSYLLWIDGKPKILVDMGGGSFLRFGQAQAKLSDLSLVAISHLHPDHVSDLPALLWLSNLSRQEPLPIVGPSGNDRMPAFPAFLSRLFDEKNGAFQVLGPALGAPQVAGVGGSVRLDVSVVDATKSEPSTVFSRDGVTVTALGIPHGNIPALAYRVETRNASVVLSSDQNGTSPGFVDFARGADVLIMHLVIPAGATNPLHASPAVVGRVARDAGVGRLIVSHLGPFDLDAAVTELKKFYTGPLTVGADLQCTPVTSAAVAETQGVGNRVNVNGMRMYYEVSGAGDPLVVLHGAYMNIPSMGAIIPALAKTHKVYALELQGHGRTTDIARPITYPNMADDVAAFMDSVGLRKADVFGYSMGAEVGLQLAIRHPAKVNRLVAASAAYDLRGWQPAFTEMIPQMTVEMMSALPFAKEYPKLAANPNGFPEFARKLIALEKEPMAWEADLKALKTPVLIIAGDADVMTLEHSVAMFRLLGGGVMGDMGKPLSASRLAILPATSHTAVITQVDLLHGLIEPFLKGQTPKGFFEQ